MKPRLLALLLAVGSAHAGDFKIENPWIRAVPPGSAATAAFMTILNSSDKPIVISGGSSPVAGEVKPMITTKSRIEGHEVMGMEFVESFTVAARSKRVLEPGGDHIMLMKLKKVPARGSTVSLTIQVDAEGRKQAVTLEVPVR